ncbi:baeRF6 domain-containing protein [Fundicoccus sp. Sow4_H7]|uniref:baeRF6 domain-containing protein n=1 Tax=Fundicoccus sp. Sow4_H7 TaxID=3438784 RepID=UPI003F92E7FC
MQELLTFPTEELFQDDQLYLTISLDTELSPINSDKNRIKLDQLIKKAEQVGKENYDPDVVAKLIKGAKDFQKDADFQEMGMSNLVIIVTADETYYYRLERPIEEGVTLSERPNLSAIIENYQYVTTYHLLVLSREKMRLFVGQQERLTEVDLSHDEDAPVDVATALGEEYTQISMNAEGGIFHGQSDTSSEKEIDLENYFRIVDRYVYENYSKETQYPLVLFALTENVAEFRRISKNKYLSEFPIEASPMQLSDNEIKERMAAHLNHVVEARHQDLMDRFNETTPQYKLESQYNDLAFSSLQGRIDFLLIQKGLEVTGTIDEDGQYVPSPKDDYLSRLIWNTVRAKGRVYILDAEKMPQGMQIAAVLRY